MAGTSEGISSHQFAACRAGVAEAEKTLSQCTRMILALVCSLVFTLTRETGLKGQTRLCCSVASVIIFCSGTLKALKLGGRTLNRYTLGDFSCSARIVLGLPPSLERQYNILPYSLCKASCPVHQEAIYTHETPHGLMQRAHYKRRQLKQYRTADGLKLGL